MSIVNNTNQSLCKGLNLFLEDNLRPFDYNETEENKDMNWEIFDENNSEGILRRYWFKQNYVDINYEKVSITTYH